MMKREPLRGVRALSPRGLVAPRLGISYVRDAWRAPNWENLTFTVPWTNLAVIPLRGSSISPAEALRHE